MKNNNQYYNFGYNKFGPFLYGFSRWLDKNLNKHAYDKVFFFARDGYMMIKATKLICPNDLGKEYVYFSRKSICQALLYDTNTLEDSLRYISKEKYISYGKLLEYFGFNYKEAKNICLLNEIDIDEELEFTNILNNKTVKKIYSLLKEKINKKSKNQANLLKQYLKQISFKGNIAIVDIGWYGYMQYYLEKFAKMHNIPVHITGYYVGIEQSDNVIGNCYGYVYSKKNLKRKKDLLCCFGLLERLFQSREGSTLGYRLEKNKVVPTLDNYEYKDNKELIQHIKDMQVGALNFVKVNLSNKLENMDLINPLINAGKSPTLSETKLFKDYYLMDGSKIFFIPQKVIYKYSIKEFVHALSNSPWKTGFMKAAFKIDFPYYKIYSLLKK